MIHVDRARLPNGSESRIGKESIRVYALQRPGLVHARRDRMKIIKAQVACTQRLICLMDRFPDDEEIEQMLNDEMEELRRLLADDQPYAGMARQYVASTGVLG